MNKNKIIICSYYGKGYGDNSKYLVEEILSRNLNMDIVWMLNDELYKNGYLPDGVRRVRYGSRKALYEMSTSRIWIDNCRKSFHTPKRKNQYYIQTWHGGIPLKRIEKDAESKLSRYYISRAKHDSIMADLMISNSTFKTNIIKESFWYEGKILESGIPKLDGLLNPIENLHKKIYSEFSLSHSEDDNVKILLYAPTFRHSGTLEPYKLNFKKIIEILVQKFGGEWIILVRLHPNISDSSGFIDYNDKIINASNYPDMQELMAISDILITDYSGIMFEYIYTSKPLFLYASDLDSYLDERGHYFDLKTLPFTFSEDFISLENNILSFDECKYKDEISKFKEKVGIVKNDSCTKEIVDDIVSVINI